MARKKFSLEALQSAFSDENKGRKNSSAGKFYNFFNMDFDESCTVRFLPDANESNPKGFLVEKKMHRLEINGETETVPCLTMYGEECPICQTAKAFYDEGDEDNGKKFYRSLNHVAQVLVKKDPIEYDDANDTCEGKVKGISVSYQIFSVMKQAINDGELEAPPCDYEEGCDFTIKKTKNGKWAKYDLGTKFAKRETALTEEEIELAEEGMVDLSTLLPEKPSLAKIEAKLEAALTGNVYEEPDDKEDEKPAKKPTSTPKKAKAVEVAEEEEEEEEETPKPNKAKAKAKAKAAPVDDDDGEGEEEEDEDSSNVLAKLRARRAKMKEED